MHLKCSGIRRTSCMREHQPGSPAPIDDGSPLEFVPHRSRVDHRKLQFGRSHALAQDIAIAIAVGTSMPDPQRDPRETPKCVASSVIFCVSDEFILRGV